MDRIHIIWRYNLYLADGIDQRIPWVGYDDLIPWLQFINIPEISRSGVSTMAGNDRVSIGTTYGKACLA